MRLSVKYDGTRAIKTHPYLDGHKLPLCIEADDEEGYAIVHKRDENGRLVIANNGELATWRVEGIVWLIAPDYRTPGMPDDVGREIAFVS